MIPAKTCPRCHRTLPATHYYRAASSYCKQCELEYKRQQYARTRKKPNGIFYDPDKGRCYDHRDCSKRIHWSTAMVEKMRRLFPVTKNEDLAIDLGVSVRTLVRKARELGIDKSKAWMQARSRRNCRTMAILNKCRRNSGMYQKGHVPANKKQ